MSSPSKRTLAARSARAGASSAAPSCSCRSPSRRRSRASRRGCTSKLTPSTALHRADLALEHDPARDREVLDQAADLDQRLPGELAGGGAAAGCALTLGSCGSPTVSRACSGRRPARSSAHRRRRIVDRRAGTRPRARVVGTTCSRGSIRAWSGCDVGAARVEVAAGGSVDQARRACPGSAPAPRRARAVQRRDRLQQPPRVGVLGAVNKMLASRRARRSAPRTSPRSRRRSPRPRRGRA